MVTHDDSHHMTLARRKGDDSETACWSCTQAENKDLIRSGSYMVVLDFGDYELILCPRHEMEALELLLNNYVRRLRRGKTRQVLLKEDDEEEGTTYAG